MLLVDDGIVGLGKNGILLQFSIIFLQFCETDISYRERFFSEDHNVKQNYYQDTFYDQE